MSEQNPENKADELFERAYGPPRPKPEAPMGPGHRALLALSLVTILAVAGYTILQIPSMPEEVPVRFGFDGTVSATGSPMSALWLSLLMAAMVLFIAWFSTKPHWMNYPFMITEDNAEQAYRVSQQMMVQLAAAVTLATVGMASPWVEWPLVWLTGGGTVLVAVVCLIGIIRVFRAR